jgi:hypothetical protein
VVKGQSHRSNGHQEKAFDSHHQEALISDMVLTIFQLRGHFFIMSIEVFRSFERNESFKVMDAKFKESDNFLILQQYEWIRKLGIAFDDMMIQTMCDMFMLGVVNFFGFEKRTRPSREDKNSSFPELKCRTSDIGDRFLVSSAFSGKLNRGEFYTLISIPIDRRIRVALKSGWISQIFEFLPNHDYGSRYLQFHVHPSEYIRRSRDCGL